MYGFVNVNALIWVGGCSLESKQFVIMFKLESGSVFGSEQIAPLFEYRNPYGKVDCPLPLCVGPAGLLAGLAGAGQRSSLDI